MYLHKVNIHLSFEKCNYKIKMPRKKETITLSVPPGTKQQLEAIADRLGIFWGTKPSPSGLVTKIAQQEFEVANYFRLSSSQTSALQQAIKDLVDAGHTEQAQSVITLLLDRGNLEIPLRRALMRQVDQTIENWRNRIDDLINQNQAFHLAYGNSQGEALDFSIRYASIVFHEKRLYIQAWCDETNNGQDIPELLHNRCLRFDRIQGLFPMSGSWRGHLDTIDVQFHLKKGLAKAYEPKEGDIDSQLIEEEGNQGRCYRIVTRRISNSFWFFREILPYGEDCELIAPDSLRQLFRAKVQALAAHYDREPHA
jgi:predicted DNA-binding transcriptional regulator YafY